MAAHRFTTQPAPRRLSEVEARAWYNDDDFGKAFSRLTKPGEVELTSPALQEAWVAGAIGLAARMLGNVPFVIVQEDQTAMKEHEQRSKAAKTTGDFRMADERLRRARSSGPFRARDALLAGNLRAPEQALERIPAHELQKLFERPNPEDSRSEIWQAVVTYLLDSAVDGGGNAIFRLVGGGTEEDFAKGKAPAEIWPHSRQGWSFRRGKDSGLIEKWKFKTKGAAGEGLPFEPHQIVLFRLWSADNSFWGRSPIAAAEDRVKLTMLGLAYNQAFLENGAMPSGVLEMDGNPNPDEVKAVQDMWEARHRGAMRTGRPAVAFGGLKWKPSAVSQRDMEYGVMLDANRDAVLASLAFHKAALGATDAINYATLRDARRMIWTNVLLPIAGIIEEALYRTLFSQIDGGKVWGMFDVSGVEELREDLSAKVMDLGALVGAGRVPYNDAVELIGLGLPAKEGVLGEEALVQMGLVPESLLADPFAGLGGEPDAGGKPGTGEDEGETEEGSEGDEGSRLAQIPGRHSDARQVGLDIVDAEGIILARTGQRGREGDPPGERANPEILPLYPDRARPEITVGGKTMKAGEFWGQWWRASGAKQEKSLQKSFRKFLFDLRAEQLDRLKVMANTEKGLATGQRELTKEDLDKALIELEATTKGLKGLLGPWWEKVAKAQLERLAEELDGELSFSLAHPAWKAFIKDKEIKVVNISETIREAIRREMAAGVDVGENITQLQERVRKAFNGLAQPARTLRVARTETAQAANGVRYLTFVEEGVTTVQWVDSGDGVVRASHQDYEAAGPQEIGTDWTTLSADSHGSNLKYPLDPNAHPAEVVNCRCVAVAAD